MNLFNLSIVFFLLLSNISVHSMTDKECKEYKNQFSKKEFFRDWNSRDADTLIYSNREKKTPSELANYFKINDVPIKKFKEHYPDDCYEQNYQTSLYIFLKGSYSFKDFLKILENAFST